MTDGSALQDTSEHAAADGVSPGIRALADELMPLFYSELRGLARRARGRLGSGATLQTTALVHETYFKLRGARGWNDDAHFLRAAALAMRHVLINHAETRLAAKRGANAEHLSLTAAEHVAAHDEDAMLVNLNESLQRLAQQQPRLAQIVECRYFGGYDDESTARALNLSERAVRRDWALARAWLHRELQVGEGGQPLFS